MEDNDYHNERPWIMLTTTYDVEAWADQFNKDLQRLPIKPNAQGYGICFRLIHGGEIFMHTTPEGEILLDVTDEGTWVTPVLAAIAETEVHGSIWRLSGDILTQLLLGLSGLIASSKVVLQHDFKGKK